MSRVKPPVRVVTDKTRGDQGGFAIRETREARSDRLRRLTERVAVFNNPRSR